jgi:hypothetical protein
VRADDALRRHGVADPADQSRPVLGAEEDHREPGAATAAEIALRLPAAARLALDPRSRKNAGKRRGYPKELTRRELAGMALGPWLYLRAAWRARERRTP